MKKIQIILVILIFGLTLFFQMPSFTKIKAGGCGSCVSGPPPQNGGFCSDTQQSTCQPQGLCGCCDYTNGVMTDAACGGGGGCTVTSNNCGNCGGAVGPGGTRSCVDNCNGTSTQTCCNDGAPLAPTLISPANGANLDTNSTPSNPITLSWSPPASWGYNCSGDSNQYRLLLSSDNVNFYSPSGFLPSSTTSFNLSPLQWGVTYYWYVEAIDYGVTTSSTWSFTINQSPVLTGVGEGLVNGSDVCGNSISGLSKELVPTELGNTSNPVQHRANFYDPYIGNASTPHTAVEVRLAFIPSSSSTNPYFDNQTYENGDTIQKLAASSKSIEISLNIENKKMYVFSSSAFLDGGVSSGDDTNEPGTATAKGFGSLSNITQSIGNGGSIFSLFTTRFNNSPNPFTSGRYNIYVEYLTRTSKGEIISSYANQNGLGNMVYKKMDSSAASSTWGVDLNPPAVGLAQIDYSPLGKPAGSFSILDNITDNNTNDSGIKDTNISASIYSSKAGSRITSINNGNPLPTVSPGVAFSLVNNNGSINNTYNINKNLFDLTKNLHATFTVLIGAQDQACNVTPVVSNTIGQPFPWLAGYLGSISTQTGIPELDFPNNYNPVPAVMNLPLAPPQVPYFATYSAINQSLSGNAASQVSSQKEEVNLNPAYVNNALLPPDGTTSWYTYFQTLIKKNYTGTYLTFNPNGSNTISSHLGVTSNNGTILVAQAPANTDIVIPANTICDEATVILIDGKLTLYPNFTIGGTVNKNGCIFIASGDILIGNTIQSNVPLGSTASAQYESVFAQFVTDKEFATYRGYFNPQYPNKGVGLYLNGGVIANQVTLQRDLNYTGNSGQPAHIFEFDPKYRELFRDVFAITKYSIREVTN